MFTARTLAEGKWPILILATISVATLLWCPVVWAPVLPAALLVFVISFFRDPDAKVPADEKLIVAPATGKIVEIKPVGETTMLAIFLSIFDVHHPDASTMNEYRLIDMETTDGYRVSVKQIAGLIARRIVGWAGEGAML